jgi:putative phosphoribosyl transferase
LPGAKMIFEDRSDAGRRLAERLAPYADERPIVFALPRGGVPVGAEVAHSLGAPLEVIVSRKLGAPGQPEFGIGAVAPGGVRILNERAVRALDIGEDYLNLISARESAEVERRLRLFRGEGRPYPDLEGRTAILVDDGLATGVTARAALLALRTLAPRRLVLAVPVCAPQTANLLRPETDDLICLLAPTDLEAIGFWYRDFDQVPDGEVVRLLEEARRRRELDGSEEKADPEEH